MTHSDSSNNTNFMINPKRLKYLLKLYDLSDEEFLQKLKGKRKTDVLTKNDLTQIFEKKKEVDISILNKTG